MRMKIYLILLLLAVITASCQKSDFIPVQGHSHQDTVPERPGPGLDVNLEDFELQEDTIYLEKPYEKD